MLVSSRDFIIIEEEFDKQNVLSSIPFYPKLKHIQKIVTSTRKLEPPIDTDLMYESSDTR